MVDSLGPQGRIDNRISRYFYKVQKRHLGASTQKTMIKKIVNKRELDGCSEIKENLEYWLSSPAEERIEAVEELRMQRYGSPRIQ